MASDHRLDLLFWQGLLEREGGDPVLELGCGSGRLLLPLLEAGFDIVGLDNSSDMLERCRRIAKLRGLDPILVQADMTEYQHSHRFHTLICAAGTFTLLAGPQEMEAALKTAWNNLYPKGTLTISMDRPGAKPTGEVIARDIERASDGARLRCILTPLALTDPETEHWLMTNEVWKGSQLDRVATAPIAFRRPSPSEFFRMLEKAGFVEVELLTGNNTDHFSEGEYIVQGKRPP